MTRLFLSISPRGYPVCTQYFIYIVYYKAGHKSLRVVLYAVAGATGNGTYYLQTSPLGIYCGVRLQENSDRAISKDEEILTFRTMTIGQR